MKIMLNIVIVLLSLGGCKPQDPPIPITPTSITPVINRLESKGEGYGDILIHNGKVIAWYRETGTFSLYAFDMELRDTLWKTEFTESATFDPSRINSSCISNGNLVFGDGGWVMVVSLLDGKIKWSHYMEDGYFPITGIGNWVYKADEVSKSTSTLFRFDINTGTKEEVFRLTTGDYGTGTYAPGLLMPVKWTHPSGDEILVLQNRTFNWAGVGQQEPADASRMDILGYNLTADTMLWYRKGLAKISSVATPVIDGDKVYFYGGDKVHCIHPATGEDIWKFQVGGSNALEFVSSNILLHGDMLIAKPDSRSMYALDKEPGQQIWYNPQTMSSPSAMTIVSDTVYFTGYYVNGVDVNTGELVVQYESPSNGVFLSSVGINPDNGYIYASDGVYLYCLDPKKMKK